MDRTDCIKRKACTEASGSNNLPCRSCGNYIPRPGSKNSNNFKMEKNMNKNLSSLNDALFSQLERLNDNNLSTDALNAEITRSQAICGVSTQIINNAALALKAHTTINTGIAKSAPKMLGGGDGKE